MGKILYYAKSITKSGRHVQQIIEVLVPDGQIEICRTIGGLSAKLRQPGLGLYIIVILAADMADLDNLYDLRDLFSNLRIILILPDRHRGTISKGYKLYPRFLTFTDSNFKETRAVLGNLLETHNPHITL
jgi:hypothetical protein